MSAAHRFAAKLGLLAVLFQAVLFGWHHHDLIFSGRLPAPVVEKAPAAPDVADSEDGCEICQVLHHLTAAPVDIPTVRPLCGLAGVSILGERAVLREAVTAAFQARAPPSPAAAIG